ncbi:MAG: hypothetical protein K2W96_15225 [Gemmataceae bacterium]|nr:hypothetical protein [Gemmataceae bacterium]
MVLIAVVGKYKHKDFKELPHAVPSAAMLGKAMQAREFNVRYLCGSRVAGALKDAAGKATITEADDGKGMSDAIKSWMKDVAEAKPALALLILSGHGMHVGSARLMAQDDGPGDDGVTVDEMGDASAALGLPLVVVHDACRTEIKPVELNIKDGKPKKEEAREDAPARSSLDYSRRDDILKLRREWGDKRPTVLYSSRKGDTAPDKDDLVSNLASAIRWDDKTKRILFATFPALEKGRDLTLLHWFHHGIMGRLRDHGLAPTHEIVVRAVPLDAPVLALADGKRVANRKPFVALDLMRHLQPRWGRFTAAWEQGILRTTHPLKGTGDVKLRYASGEVNGDEGFDVSGPSGRMLVLDLVAVHEGPKRPRQFVCEIHAAHRPSDDPNPKYQCDSAYPYAFAYDRIVSARVPLDRNLPMSFNGFGFAYPRRGDWPTGSSLLLAGARLESNPTGLAGGVIPKIPDLLDGWIAANPAVDGSPRLGIATGATRGLVLKPAKDKDLPLLSKAGCDLAAPVYVPKGHLLEIDAVAPAGKAAELELEVARIEKEDGKAKAIHFLDRAPVKIPPGGGKKTVPFVSDGFVTYLCVGIRSEGVVLRSLRVIPKK